MIWLSYWIQTILTKNLKKGDNSANCFYVILWMKYCDIIILWCVWWFLPLLKLFCLTSLFQCFFLSFSWTAHFIYSFLSLFIVLCMTINQHNSLLLPTACGTKVLHNMLSHTYFFLFYLWDWKLNDVLYLNAFLLTAVFIAFVQFSLSQVLLYKTHSSIR